MKFAVNDHIRIIARCNHFDRTGTVTEILPDADHPFRVEGLEVWPLWFGAHELVLAERPVGDITGGAVGAGGAVGEREPAGDARGPQNGVQA